jgi:thioredoxin family protein
MSLPVQINSPILAYVESDELYYGLYESYQPDLATLTRVAIARPSAHVIVPSRLGCKDCIRNMPRMARIADFLPGWTWDVYTHDEHNDRSEALGITNIPTFVIFEAEGGRELGRIVENPVSGSLEVDLLQIAASTRQ